MTARRVLVDASAAFQGAGIGHYGRHDDVAAASAWPEGRFTLRYAPAHPEPPRFGPTTVAACPVPGRLLARRQRLGRQRGNGTRRYDWATAGARLAGAPRRSTGSSGLMRSRPSGQRDLGAWWATNRGRVTLLLIAGVALGGIACMVLVVVALIVGSQ